MKSGIIDGFKVVVICAAFVISMTGWSAAEIRFGVLPRLSAVELTNMFGPLADYLSKETGEKVKLVIPKDFDAFKAMVKAGQVDIAFANSIVYVQLRKDLGIEPLAVSAEQKGGTKFRGIIITRKDSGINNVQQLKGKRLIFVERDSAAGYIFQLLLLNKSGLDIKNDFTVLPFAKKHDNVTMAVFNKSADAGGIREDDLDKMKDKVDLSQLKIIGYSDYFPNWPLFSTPQLAKEKAHKMKEALLKLKPGTGETGKVLGPAKVTGFSGITDKDYDRLREAAKLAGAL